MLRALLFGSGPTKEQLKEQAREKLIQAQRDEFKADMEKHAAAQKAKADQRKAERAKELAARAEKLKILEQSHKDSKLVDVKRQEELAKRKADRLNSLQAARETKLEAPKPSVPSEILEEKTATRQSRKELLENTVFNRKAFSEDSAAMSFESKREAQFAAEREAEFVARKNALDTLTNRFASAVAPGLKSTTERKDEVKKPASASSTTKELTQYLTHRSLAFQQYQNLRRQYGIIAKGTIAKDQERINEKLALEAKEKRELHEERLKKREILKEQHLQYKQRLLGPKAVTVATEETSAATVEVVPSLAPGKTA